jgi:hypothetical protein
MRTRCWV